MYFFPHSISNLKNNKSSFILFPLIVILSFLIFSCSSSKRFTTENNINSLAETNFIRILINEKPDDLKLKVNSQILLSDEKKPLAKINSGNIIIFRQVDGKIELSILDKIFLADTLYISSGDADSIIKLDENKLRGRIKIFLVNSQIKVVNQIGLEEYVRGVMTKEMPLGQGNENYEALKAFSICVRTYALLKIFEDKSYFDIYPDTRDQIYGGVDAENPYSTRIVDETRGMILSYDGKSAIIFYHASCGGYTEDVKNVFSNNDLPYLTSIKDGDEPYCNIAPKFNWTEEYSEQEFISRLFNAKLLSSKYFKIKNLEIKSRFNSGRINELVISLIDNNQTGKSLSLFGNNIRYIIKTSIGKSILRSTLFNIVLGEDNGVKIIGKGNGHGVGLCQWGAIGQSKMGIDYLSILNHYFPGTKVISYYD